LKQAINHLGHQEPSVDLYFMGSLHLRIQVRQNQASPSSHFSSDQSFNYIPDDECLPAMTGDKSPQLQSQTQLQRGEYLLHSFRAQACVVHYNVFSGLLSI